MQKQQIGPENQDLFLAITAPKSSMVICILFTGCVTKSKSVNYFSRGVGYYSKDDYDGAIFYFTKDIEINPRHAKAYSNRAHAYYHKGEYDKAWEDVHKAQSLEFQVPPILLKLLREASGRESP
ncbi:MAG: tetratricopeptide repeat protein [Planctomycetota bacterium]